MAHPVNSIALLVHPAQKIRYGAFLRRIVDDCWKPEGRRVFLQQPFQTPEPRADCAIVHVDMTHIPPVYGEYAKLHPRSVNAAVRDISKRTICSTLVGRDDAWDGPVIVKTDLNHRGRAERVLGATVPDWSWILPSDGYRVFDRKRDVPARVWDERGLVVQRMHVERAGKHYMLRQWFFFGERDILSDFLGSEPLVKFANVVDWTPLYHEVPDALRRRRDELGFEFGKFDFVIEDGEPVLLDANLTPDNGPEIRLERCGEVCRHLAPGIDSIAERPS